MKHLLIILISILLLSSPVIGREYYDLNDKEMKDYAKLRSHQIDSEFTEVATQYLHFMNKYQKKYFFDTKMISTLDLSIKVHLKDCT